MAHLIGYVDDNDDSYFGVEQYLDDELRGRDGSIIGLATPWIGEIGANNFNIDQPEHGVDVYLTIDPVIQKELESTMAYYLDAFRADSVAVTVLDPFT
jgi:cell division protein FtsI/penicillin-binding protein 2